MQLLKDSTPLNVQIKSIKLLMYEAVEDRGLLWPVGCML